MSSTANAVAAGERGRTKQGASKPASTKPSTTAGKVSVCWKLSRRKFSKTPPSRSSHATIAPTSRLTARSTPTAAASMAASTATRVRAIAISGIPRGSISKPSSTPSPMLRCCWQRNSPSPATSRRRSRLGQIPILISRSNASGASRDRSSKCWRKRTIRSASSPNRRWLRATSTFCSRWQREALRRSRCRSPVSIAALPAPWSRVPRRRPNVSRR